MAGGEDYTFVDAHESSLRYDFGGRRGIAYSTLTGKRSASQRSQSPASALPICLPNRQAAPPMARFAVCVSLQGVVGEVLRAIRDVGALAATWAWFIPPSRPRKVLGDTPIPLAKGDSPSALPLLAVIVAAPAEPAGVVQG